MSGPFIRCITAATLLFAGSLARAIQPTTQPDAPAATRPANNAELQQRLRAAGRLAVRDHWADAPVSQVLPLDQLLHFSLRKDFLHIDPSPLGDATPSRICVSGSPAIWVVTRRSTRPGMAGAPRLLDQFSLTRYDLDASGDDIWQTSLTVCERFIVLSATSDTGNISLVQATGMVRLRVMKSGELGQPPAPEVALQSPSLLGLRDEHPREFRRYAMKALACLSTLDFLQPGPTDIFLAFPEIAPDPAAVSALQRIVPELDADDPADREAASEKLAALGPPGVLAALRLDESDLADEQKLRLRALFHANRRRPDLSPAAARRDPPFLLDCLESPDPRVRSAALSAWHELPGHGVRFDIDPSVQAKPPTAEEVDALRLRLVEVPTTAPANLPATRPAPAGQM